MKITNDRTDESILEELGRRLERARIDAALTQADLAREAGVSKRTVERIEAGHAYQLPSLLRVLRVLRLLDGLEVLVPGAGLRPMERLDEDKPRRQRAPRKRARRASAWTWDDKA